MRITNDRKVSAIFLTVIMMLTACYEWEPALLQAQLCVQDEEGMSRFVDELKAIANEKNMDYYEDYLNRESDVYMDPYRKDGPSLFDAQLRNENMVLTVTNNTLPGYQLYIAFLSGSNPDTSEASKFAEDVVLRLERQWEVLRLPSNKAAQPLSDCEDYGTPTP